MVFTRHLLHPEWKKLEVICEQIERLRLQAQNLRNKIDSDLSKYSDETLKNMRSEDEKKD
jgi:hypothetical protein